MGMPIAALIYDFDKTLAPKDMQEYGYLPGIGSTPEEFWPACRDFALRNDADGILTYMYMMCLKAKGSVELTRSTLEAQGHDITFFPGVEEWFDAVNHSGEICGVRVEHYIISSGLKEIIEGSAIGRKFKAIFASSFVYDEEGHPVWPATAINYTSKTQYLFRINKGIPDITNDSDLNAYTPHSRRRVPFSNMIYIGDGMTDVPCMKMTKQRGGYSIAVHAGGPNPVTDDMLLHSRADFACEADYRTGSELFQVVNELLRRIRTTYELSHRHGRQMEEAFSRSGEAVPPDEMRGGFEDEE